MSTIKRVFISYAWESDEFKQSIWELAGWLTAASENTIEVISDHLYSVRPPTEGWHRWMANEVNKADVVLSVCSPKYVASFEGNNADERGGFGVTHEGLIITARFYETKGNNEKYFPILPDNGNFADIPVILRAYNNNLKFPSGNQGILNLIIGENPSHPNTNNGDTVKTSIEIDEEAQQTIQLEKVIVDEITKTINTINTDMSFDVQILIRSFLALSDAEKISIIKTIFEDFEIVPGDPDERDRLFLSSFKDPQALSKLWLAVNDVNPFENQLNPFQ
ncbi:toll/interleukin-1 receptor domain-containing protein [Mucilaginibacter sp. 44-25]|uniref:toll/interleukin-1 receptor domain-containing protein n=1 Tax=Mucilaginibacter sp. 44-25 TaxID=1895794 RepID=UPI00095BE59E|nr:toll/interleukin-1 receptor domain-containing protein [Mucilaginibacter sp. 44-25]OJW12782.1 MAG: hypothetical protein BGO48_02555 [Mucilaginibacter sp. 44-25]